MIGIIAEKPSQARNFCKAFFGSERVSKGVFEGSEIRVVPLRGHLYELVPPEGQYEGADALRLWKLETLPWDESRFSWEFQPRLDAKGSAASSREVIKNAKNKLKGCSEIVIATDDDPETHEGSGLACEVIFNAPIRAPKYSRMYFVDESASEVKKAFRNRKTLPRDLSSWGEWQTAFFRSRWDYLAGLQETRAATIIGGGYDYVVRSGRLKSAMVVIVGDQLKAIAEYKQIPFFQNRFRDDHGVVYVNPEEPQFKERSEVPNVYHASSVAVDSKQRKTQAPPRLMDLAGLSSVLASRGIGSREVLNLYQAMYEKQVVSYPRTEDKTITPEQFDELSKNVDAIARVVGIDPKLLTHRTARATHVKPKGAHGANRPGPRIPQSLDALDIEFGRGAGAIYELLARSALAMFAEDYVYERQKGHVSEYPKFVGSANVPLSDGWHAVLGRTLVDEDADENSQGLGSKADPFVHEGYPPKPRKPTMKWLMGQLEKRNVGTGATRTSTYAEVTAKDGPKARKKGQLMIDSRGAISMAPAGEIAYQLLQGTNIGSLDLTERVLAQMADVAQGRINPDATLSQIKSFVTSDIATMQENASKAGIAGQARADVDYVEGVFKGSTVRFKRVFSGHTFTDDEVKRLLAGEKISFEAMSKAGRPYTATGSLGSGTYNGHKMFGFQLDTSGWGASSDGHCPASWSGHMFTDFEKTELEAGRPVSAEFTWKSGKKSVCAVKLIDGRIVAEFMDGYDGKKAKRTSAAKRSTTKRTSRSTTSKRRL